MNSTYMALVRCAIREFPGDPIVQLYQARVLLTQSRQTEGIEFLRSCEGTLGRTHRAYWGTELANMYASAGFEKSCMQWLKAVQDEPGFDAPLTLYTRSCAHEGLQHWDEAIDLAEQCVAAAPGWVRARTYLIHCLLARGRVDAAQQQIELGTRLGYEEAYLDIAAAMLPMSMGRFDKAQPQLEAILNNWPQADFLPWVRRTLCVLLVELGEYDQAREIAGGQEERMSLPPIPRHGGAKHCYIPLPLIAQNRDQCVPTSVAMAVYPQGKKFDPDVMYREMHGREGTALWRMREWCQSRGLSVVPIRLERDAVISMLEAGVPLIGTLEGPFNSHVDVICGFNNNLETLYVRDPGHWAPAALTWEIGLSRYSLHAGLLAVIAEERADVLATAEHWRSDECGALMDLSQAAASADVQAAEAAFARIGDDTLAAFLRDGYAVNVAISPNQFRERMKLISQDESAHLVARFRAVMSLGSDDADGVLAKLLEEAETTQRLGSSRRYLTLLKQMNEGNWSIALDTVDQLLVRGGRVAQFWELKSDILAELGQHNASREALDLAIELEPLRISTREKALNRAANRLTMQEFVAELDGLLAEDPKDKRLLQSRAALLQEGPDGRAYEQAALEAIRWLPRMPSAYTALLGWYSGQGRQDLCDRLLADARKMLPDVFSESEKSADDKPATESGVLEALPEDKTELLDLVWKPSDPRREAALARAIELQDSGHLRWYEVARLLACRLLVADRRGEELVAPEKLLPESPPGARHWFADVLCDLLTRYEPGLRTAIEVDRWLVRVVPNFEDYSELWFQKVLLLEQALQMEQALEELRKLLKRYPAMSSALYRMGVVKYRQEDYASARRHFEQALEVNPGLFGAMEMLRDVHLTLDQQKEALNCRRMLRRKLPYSIAYLREELLSVVEQESLNTAERLLNEAAPGFPEERIGVLRARLHIAVDRIDEAAAILSKFEITPNEDEETFEERLAAKLQVAVIRKDPVEILALCNAGLIRWPDSVRLQELKAEQLAVTDPQQSADLLRGILHEGEARAQTVWKYFQVAGKSPNDAARHVVLGAPEDRRQGLAELISDVTADPEILQHHEPYLTWALKQFPESDLLRARLAAHHSASGRAAMAVELAEELHRRNPDSVAAARLLGRCLIDTHPNTALKHLEKVCEQNRSVDYLFDLARCNQAVGNVARSQKLHWEILEQNPYVSASLTNLYLVGGSAEKLWPFLTPILNRGYGLDDEYFFVVAVKMALQLKQTLPASWFPLAVQRWAVLQIRPGYRDEQPLLQRALVAWRTRRPSDVRPEMLVPGGFIEMLKARFGWPGLKWIPKEEP
ncbi:MAG: tetratricopeptide repeat protein [Fuerstia sp.]|nr:tetratricopeptide repeat protein [Fuerstiella sp.]